MWYSPEYSTSATCQYIYMKIYIRVWVWACYYYIAPTPSRIKGVSFITVAQCGSNGEGLLQKSASVGDGCSACHVGQEGRRRLTLAGNDLHNDNSRSKFVVRLHGHADGSRQYSFGKGMPLVRYAPAKFLQRLTQQVRVVQSEIFVHGS